MREVKPLTQAQKQFIDKNWKDMTYEQICVDFKLKSIFRIRAYCKEQGYKKEKKCLSDEQKQFVRDNLFKMTENSMAKHLGMGRSYIQRFKRAEGLFSAPWNREKNKAQAKVKEAFFNVHERWCWVA